MLQFQVVLLFCLTEKELLNYCQCLKQLERVYGTKVLSTFHLKKLTRYLSHKICKVLDLGQSVSSDGILRGSPAPKAPLRNAPFWTVLYGWRLAAMLIFHDTTSETTVV